MIDDIKTMMEFNKANIFKNIPDDYCINKGFLCGLTEESAKHGIIAFRDFLYTFFDYITENESEFMPIGKKPLLRDLYQALLRIGMESCFFTESDIRLIVDCGKLSESFKEARMKKINDIFIHLSAIGFDFVDIDITSKNFKLTNCGEITITYPDNNHVLAGLKIMAEANKAIHPKGASRPVDQILLRCDYHALEGKTTKTPGRKVKSIPINIEESLNFISGESRKHLLEINGMLINNGYKYEGKPVKMGYSFIYTSKKKGTVLCTVSVDIEKCRIKINAENINTYIDFIKTMPENMYNEVKNSGWDCAKKHDPNACNPRCKGGFKFSIDGEEYAKCRGGSFVMNIDLAENAGILTQWLKNEIGSEDKKFV